MHKDILDKQDIEYIDIFSFINFWDKLKIIFFSIWNLFFLFGKKKFLSLDVTALINKFHIADIVNNKIAFNYCFLYGIKNLKKKQIELQKVIYPFENQPWEKAVCYSLKKFFPEIELIGYMHSMTIEFLLSMYPSKKEYEIMPQPEKIYTTGKISLNQLQKYYKEKQVIENCALRYEYLFELSFAKNKKKADEVFTILVSLTSSQSRTLFVLDTLISAFKNDNNFSIIIKPHPTDYLSEDFLLLPDNFKISNSSIKELLVKADVLINCVSTVCVESMKIGIPVIECASFNNQILDRMRYFPKINFSYITAAELRNIIDDIKNWNAAKKDDYYKKCFYYSEQCFTQVTSQKMQEFIV